MGYLGKPVKVCIWMLQRDRIARRVKNQEYAQCACFTSGSLTTPLLYWPHSVRTRFIPWVCTVCTVCSAWCEVCLLAMIALTLVSTRTFCHRGTACCVHRVEWYIKWMLRNARITFPSLALWWYQTFFSEFPLCECVRLNTYCFFDGGSKAVSLHQHFQCPLSAVLLRWVLSIWVIKTQKAAKWNVQDKLMFHCMELL